MADKTFNLVDWFNDKLKEERITLDFLSGKLNKLTDEIKVQLTELKDDSHHLVPIINGLHGDSMEESGHPALVKMAFRYQSRDISVEELNRILKPERKAGLLILVHGLMNDETIWHSNSTDLILRLGTFLENQQKATILYIRYNTGSHISQNGRKLCSLLQMLYDQYKDKIGELVLTGHSMGGLVIRSACHYGMVLNQSWLQVLKKVFLIGVPNEGSYLARIAYMTQYFLRRIDPSENQSIAKFFDIRSNGIKDLSFGFLVDEDWQNPKYEKEKDVVATKIYPVPGVDYYLIAATVAEKKSRNKLATFFGDGLVEKQSALSSLFKKNQIKSGNVQFRLFSGENHLSLLESNVVHEYVKESLGWKE